MTLYLFIFGLFFLFSVASSSVEFRAYRQYLFFTASFIIILLSGLRPFGVGADDLTYVDSFLKIKQYINIPLLEFNYKVSYLNMEYGFAYIMAVISSFTDDPTFFFLLIALFSIGINSYALWRFNSYIFLGLLIYYTNMYFQKDLNQIRNGLASALIFLAYYFVYTKHYLRSFFTILFAVNIHISSIIAFLVYIFNAITLTRHQSFLILFFSVLVSFFGFGFFFVSLLPESSIFYQKISFYLDWELYNYKIGLLDPVNIKNIVLTLFFIYFYSFYDKKIGWFRLFFNTLLFATCIRLVFSDFAIVSARLSAIFSFVDFLLIPATIIILRQRIVGYFIVLFYVVIVFALTLSNQKWSGSIPYTLQFL